MLVKGNDCLTAVGGQAPTLPSSFNFRRLMSALRFFVINYGLKSVAWFAFGCVVNYGLA